MKQGVQWHNGQNIAKNQSHVYILSGYVLIATEVPQLYVSGDIHLASSFNIQLIPYSDIIFSHIPLRSE